jgi:UDPglucose--hexose-1-phosphate uridylyltransferase
VTELRTDALTGAEVQVVGSRQGRPNRPASGCPFCVGGLEAPEPYEVKAFTNRWPSFPDERGEVVLYSPDHDASLATLGTEGVRRVVDLWAERTQALGDRSDIAYVLVFENRGAEVGATIPHPHGQIFAFDHVPAAPANELARARDAGRCPLCDEEPGERLVTTARRWRAWVPYASTSPYGLVLAPVDHQPDLPSLDDAGRDDLAALLVDVLGRLDRLWGEPMPYMLWFHGRPTDSGAWPEAHLHVEINVPLRAPGVMRYVAGGELGSGMFINPVEPEAAAAELRDA